MAVFFTENLKTMRLLTTLCLLFLITSCSTTTNVIEGKNKPEDYFYVQKSINSNGKWVVFLPGTSGLKIFEDEEHYFNVAKKLNKQGYTVVLVDYKPAYKVSGRKVDESTGDKILWVTEQAIQWALKNNHISKAQKGSIIGWSLAGEGMVLLANNPSKIESLNIKSLALYYPSNQEEIKLNSNLPILIQSGELDKITSKNSIQEYFGNNTNTSIIFYENAHHGFDVESLDEGKKMRFPPVVGKKYTFQYNEVAAAQAMIKLLSFLR